MTFDTKWLKWESALDKHSAEWARLVAGGQSNPSLDPRWMALAAASHGAAMNLRVAVACWQGRACAFVPLRLETRRYRGVPVRLVTLGGGLVGYHREIVAERRDPEWLAAVLESAFADGWDVLRIDDVPAESPTAAAIELVAHRRGWRTIDVPAEQSPYMPITRPWSEFYKDIPKKTRDNVGQAIRLPERVEGASMEWFERGADTERLLAAIVTVELASWKRKSGVSIPDRPEEHAYHRELLPYLESTGMLLANVLYVDERPTAYVLCCRSDGWVGQLKTSFDESVKHVGAAAIAASVKRAFDLGCREYDFLGHADPHKLKWTSLLRAQRSWLAFAPTARGRAASMVQLAASSLLRVRLALQGVPGRHPSS